jgi:hypothetical protein
MRARENYDPHNVAFAIRRRSVTGVNRKKVLRLIRMYIESTVPYEGMRRLDPGRGWRVLSYKTMPRQTVSVRTIGYTYGPLLVWQ